MSSDKEGIIHRVFKLPRTVVKRFSKLSRNTKLAASLVSVLVLVGITTVVFRNGAVTPVNNQALREIKVEETSNAPSIEATLTYTEGVVEYRDDKGEWSTAQKDIKIAKNTAIKTTGASSKATVTFQDGSIIRLDAATEVAFESLSETRIMIVQASGYVYNRVINVPERSFIVQTDHAQFQAAGTAFRTISTGDEESVEVYHNSVKETGLNGTAKEGQKFTAKHNNNPDKNGTVEKLDIELLKKDSFVVWNREQDMQNPNFKSSLGFLNDFDGPSITISEPTAGSTVEMESKADQGSTTIKGKTEPKAKLTVQSKSLGGSSPVEVTVQPDGSFDTGSLTAPIGTSVFEFVATDTVGNKTVTIVSYVFKRKTTVQEQGIALTAIIAEDKVKLEWGLVGISTPDGVKILYDDEPGLTFKDDAKALSNEGASYSIKVSELTAGKKFYFTVCRYNKATSECDVYSNEVELTIPDEE